MIKLENVKIGRTESVELGKIGFLSEMPNRPVLSTTSPDGRPALWFLDCKNPGWFYAEYLSSNMIVIDDFDIEIDPSSITSERMGVGTLMVRGHGVYAITAGDQDRISNLKIGELEGETQVYETYFSRWRVVTYRGERETIHFEKTDVTE